MSLVSVSVPSRRRAVGTTLAWIIRHRSCVRMTNDYLNATHWVTERTSLVNFACPADARIGTLGRKSCA
ncbi:hypothetical protein [Kibdelosporangium philippinense]|uniref:hypothetical protein n=1 Tax=Kibdelosporangium philippinense TaxID=211113 RepID=UPI003608FD70